MADINRDLDRYLNRRKDGVRYTGPGWFDKMFSQAEEEEKAELSPKERERLEEMEEDIKKREHELEVVHEIEEELEEKQEEEVTLYHKFMRLFKREPQEEHAMEEVEIPVVDDTHDDFQRLAEIQVRWFSRLPVRFKQAFKESEDFQELVEIYERRGVARKK